MDVSELISERIEPFDMGFTLLNDYESDMRPPPPPPSPKEIEEAKEEDAQSIVSQNSTTESRIAFELSRFSDAMEIMTSKLEALDRFELKIEEISTRLDSLQKTVDSMREGGSFARLSNRFIRANRPFPFAPEHTPFYSLDWKL